MTGHLKSKLSIFAAGREEVLWDLGQPLLVFKIGLYLYHLTHMNPLKNKWRSVMIEEKNRLNALELHHDENCDFRAYDSRCP